MCATALRFFTNLLWALRKQHPDNGDSSMCRFVFDAEEFTHPISVPFVYMNQASTGLLLYAIENVLQSFEQIDLRTVKIHFVHCTMPPQQIGSRTAGIANRKVVDFFAYGAPLPSPHSSGTTRPQTKNF